MTEIWTFTTRYFDSLIKEGLTYIEALRFMLIHPIEKFRLSYGVVQGEQRRVLDRCDGAPHAESRR
jgi:hypothetical protein